MPLSCGETSKPAFSSALTRKRRMSLSSSARRILCMGFGRLVRVTGSLHLLSPADGKFRVKDDRPGPAGWLRSYCIRSGAEGNQDGSRGARKKRSRVNGLFSLGRELSISDNIASQNARFSGRNEPDRRIADDRNGARRMTQFDGELSPPFTIVEPASWRA